MSNTHHAGGDERAKPGRTCSGGSRGLNGRKTQTDSPEPTWHRLGKIQAHPGLKVIKNWVKTEICGVRWEHTEEAASQLGLGGKGTEDVSVRGTMEQGPKGRWECPVWPG